MAASEDISQTGNFEKTNIYLTQQNWPSNLTGIYLILISELKVISETLKEKTSFKVSLVNMIRSLDGCHFVPIYLLIKSSQPLLMEWGKTSLFFCWFDQNNQSRYKNYCATVTDLVDLFPTFIKFHFDTTKHRNCKCKTI